MKKYVKLKEAVLNVIIIAFLASLALNVYQGVNIKKYKYQIDELGSESIETIRTRNEVMLSVLDTVITSKSLNNDELLIIYKNYMEIAKEEVELWRLYIRLESNKTLDHNVKIKTKTIAREEMFVRLEEYLFLYLKDKMQSDEEVIKLSGVELNNFIALRDISYDINKFFNEFTEKNLDNMIEEERKKAIIKNEYWIDMLFGFVETSNKYIDFKFEVKKEES